MRRSDFLKYASQTLLFFFIPKKTTDFFYIFTITKTPLRFDSRFAYMTRGTTTTTGMKRLKRILLLTHAASAGWMDGETKRAKGILN